MPDQQLELKMKPELEDGVHRQLFNQASFAIDGNEERDAILQVWRDQIEGTGQAPTDPRWHNASDLTDPITAENLITLIGWIVETNRKDPKVAVESYEADHERDAEDIEAWLSMKMNQDNVDDLLYKVAYATCRDYSGVVYVGWKQTLRRVREKAVIDPETKLEVTPSANEEHSEYEYRYVVREDVEEEGFDIRQVNLCDFYMYPPDAESVDKATMCMERMRYTAHDLINAIGDCGFNEDAVKNLIKTRNTGSNSEYYLAQYETDGIDPTDVAPGDGYYEIFVGFTKFPLFVGDDDEIHDEYKDDNFCFAIHPATNTVLKMNFAPVEVKEWPYFLVHILPKPDTPNGHSVCSLLEGIQAESNANVRFGIDSMNLTATPCTLVDQTEAKTISKSDIYPGALIPVKDVERSLKPMPWDHSGTRDILGYQQFLEGRGKALIAADGAGGIQQKVRKATEIREMQAAVANKAGLYNWNFNRTLFIPLAQRMVSLHSEYKQDEQEIFSDSDGKQRTLSVAALKAKYRFVPTAVSMNNSPEARLQVSQAAWAMVLQYREAVAKFPQAAKELWHQARKVLMDLGDNNPEAVLGKEPENVQPQPQAPPPGQPQQEMSNG